MRSTFVTAAGLVFIASPGDNPSSQANPMTYRAKNGKQYVAVVSGPTLNMFTLP